MTTGWGGRLLPPPPAFAHPAMDGQMKRGTPDHPKTFQLAEALGISQLEAIGLLEALFHVTAAYTPQGDVGRYTDAFIARAVYWSGSPEALIEALVTARWLDRCAVNRLVVHDWSDHADGSVRKRLKRDDVEFCRLVPLNEADTAAGQDGRTERPDRMAGQDGRTDGGADDQTEAADVAEVSPDGSESRSAPIARQDGQTTLADAMAGQSGRTKRPDKMAGQDGRTRGPDKTAVRPSPAQPSPSAPSHAMPCQAQPIRAQPPPAADDAPDSLVTALTAAGVRGRDAQNLAAAYTPRRIGAVLEFVRLRDPPPRNPAGFIRTLLETKSKPEERTPVGRAADAISRQGRNRVGAAP